MSSYFSIKMDTTWEFLNELQNMETNIMNCIQEQFLGLRSVLLDLGKTTENWEPPQYMGTVAGDHLISSTRKHHLVAQKTEAGDHLISSTRKLHLVAQKTETEDHLISSTRKPHLVVQKTEAGDQVISNIRKHHPAAQESPDLLDLKKKGKSLKKFREIEGHCEIEIQRRENGTCPKLIGEFGNQESEKRHKGSWNDYKPSILWLQWQIFMMGENPNQRQNSLIGLYGRYYKTRGKNKNKIK